jgi:hypothetical protein
MRVVLTDHWENERRVSSLVGHKLSETHLESATEKGDRSESATEKGHRSFSHKSYSALCGFRGAGQTPTEADLNPSSD